MGCVGLNNVPAWCRPFCHLSNGQQERVLLAVALCDGAVLDDFGAVIDTLSARSAAASLRRRVEAEGLSRVLVATSKAEVVSWLGADFVIKVPTMELLRRPAEFQRPRVEVQPARVASFGLQRRTTHAAT